MVDTETKERATSGQALGGIFIIVCVVVNIICFGGVMHFKDPCRVEIRQRDAGTDYNFISLKTGKQCGSVADSPYATELADANATQWWNWSALNPHGLSTYYTFSEAVAAVNTVCSTPPFQNVTPDPYKYRSPYAVNDIQMWNDIQRGNLGSK